MDVLILVGLGVYVATSVGMIVGVGVGEGIGVNVLSACMIVELGKGVSGEDAVFPCKGVAMIGWQATLAARSSIMRIRRSPPLLIIGFGFIFCFSDFLPWNLG